jgi:phage recombination protein Bet
MTDQPYQPLSILTAYAKEKGMERDDLVTVLMQTVMPRDRNGKPMGTKADLIGFLQICRRFDLDPWAREIFMIVAKGQLRPYISVDGYSKIANRHPDYDGCEFAYERGSIELVVKHKDAADEIIEKDGIVAVTCSMFKKTHKMPTVVTEFFDECWRNTEAWNNTPSRMLRHRAFIQAVRLCFGVSGAFDYEAPDEIPYQPVDVSAEDAEIIDKAKPQPPSAPKRKPPQEAAERDVEESEQAEAEKADDFIDRLNTALQTCTSQEEVDALWEEEDVLAAWSHDEDTLTLAQGMREKALKRLS